MKKIIMLLTVTGTLFAGTLSAQSKTPTAVLNAFQNLFASAANATWTDVKGIYRVDFLSEDEQVAAFFNQEGELIASSRNVSLQQIPLSLKSDLKKHFQQFSVSRIFEVDKEDGVTYYATLKNDKSQFALESTVSGDWVKRF